MNPEHAQRAPSQADAEAGAAERSEQELREAYEQELSRITSADLMLQAAVSLLNLGGRRLGPAAAPEPGDAGASGAGARDLEQVRDAIDGVRALLGVLDRRLSKELGPLRDALSQLQIAYAREAKAQPAAQSGGATTAAAGSAEGGAQSGAEKDAAGEQQQPRSPGPAERSGKLWVPGR